MQGRRNLILDANQEMTTSSVFLAAYNKGIPESYPRASLKELVSFQATHPLLFKKGDWWSIEKHRKRLMDWISSHREAA